MNELPQATVIRRKDVADGLALFWLELEMPFTFRPGQYCTIGLQGEDGKLIERAYSIVSAPHEEYLELFIELVPRPYGNLTPLLWELEEGDEVSIRPRAKGVLTFDSSFANQVMVATVTGIVPYVSILRDYVYRSISGSFDAAHGKHRFFVLHGASYLHEFAYDEELHELSQERPDGLELVYVPTVSRPWKKDDSPENQARAIPNVDWRGETGRVNLILERYLAQWGLSPEDSLIYVCGNPGMIEDVKARFVPAGWHIKEERFWK